MNKNQIVKPASLLKEDLVNGLVDLCNNCALPLFVVESVLKDLMQEVHTAAQQQLEKDRADYNKELKKLQEEINE